MSGEIPTYPYEEEDSPEYKIKHLTAKVEELERDVKRELSRALEAERQCSEHSRIGDGYWERMMAAEAKNTIVRLIVRRLRSGDGPVDRMIVVEMLERALTATPSPSSEIESKPSELAFEQAWALKEAEGYQYGEDALEQVRMGWEMAKGKI